MKKGYWVIVALMVFSMISTVIIILQMPDRVPVHYNAAGVVDRMGSRFEYLIFPTSMVLIGVPFIFVGRKGSVKRSEEIALLSTGIGIMTSLNVVNIVLLLKTLHYEAALEILTAIAHIFTA